MIFVGWGAGCDGAFWGSALATDPVVTNRAIPTKRARMAISLTSAPV